MSRTRHYRDLIAWQKAMELARLVYTSTEEFPKSETFGLRMQLRRSSVNVASHIAEAHGRLNDAEMRKGLGAARAAINELQTQTELAASLGFFNEAASGELLDLGTRVAKHYQCSARSVGTGKRTCELAARLAPTCEERISIHEHTDQMA
jgi:four helix bundle protein